MIVATDILSWVSGELSLSRVSNDFSLDVFYRALNDGIATLAKKWMILRKTEVFTTTYQNGLFVLSTDIRPTRIISLKTSLRLPISKLPYQKMNEYKQQLAGNYVKWPYQTIVGQPAYYCFYPTSSSGELGDIDSPGAYLEIQDSSLVPANATITVEYEYLPKKYGRSSPANSIIDFGEEWELALKFYVAYRLCPRYRPDRTKYYKQEYLEELESMRRTVRRSLQSTEVETTDVWQY